MTRRLHQERDRTQTLRRGSMGDDEMKHRDAEIHGHKDDFAVFVRVLVHGIFIQRSLSMSKSALP